jgi:hypothetical protein
MQEMCDKRVLFTTGQLPPPTRRAWGTIRTGCQSRDQIAGQRSIRNHWCARSFALFTIFCLVDMAYYLSSRRRDKATAPAPTVEHLQLEYNGEKASPFCLLPRNETRRSWVTPRQRENPTPNRYTSPRALWSVFGN